MMYARPNAVEQLTFSSVIKRSLKIDCVYVYCAIFWMDLLELWLCAQFKDMFSMEESSMTTMHVDLSMRVA